MQNLISTESITPVATMTSREIAELTGKEHKNVCRDIRTMLEALEKDRLSFEHIFQDAYGRNQQGFKLDRELTLTLVSGYDIPLRHRVVLKLSELESAVATPMLPVQQAASFLKASMEIASLFHIPTHIAQVEVVKQTKLQIGFDATPYLRLAPAQDSILIDEQRLEPTEIGAIFGITARKVNSILAAAGLQEKSGGEWVAIGEAQAFSNRHQWVTGFKSGYNLKWQVSKIREIIAEACQVSSE